MLATRKAVGDDMDLMIDPACEYNTWADTLKVGRACDEAHYLWLEDPPVRPERTILARFEYGGRDKPMPMDSLEDE